MGQVHPMPNQQEGSAAIVPSAATVPAAAVRSIDSAHCALCGAKLSAKALRYHLVSPQRCEMITVCHLCRKAALGEGYRPAE